MVMPRTEYGYWAAIVNARVERLLQLFRLIGISFPPTEVHLTEQAAVEAILTELEQPEADETRGGRWIVSNEEGGELMLEYNPAGESHLVVVTRLRPDAEYLTADDMDRVIEALELDGGLDDDLTEIPTFELSGWIVEQGFTIGIELWDLDREFDDGDGKEEGDAEEDVEDGDAETEEEPVSWSPFFAYVRKIAGPVS